MSATATAAPTTASRTGFPPGIPFIIGNEAAERFSYYGMRAILWIHLTSLLLGFQDLGDVPAAERAKAAADATEAQHLFMASVYAFPMIGALLADRLFGKYNVIFWLSLVYCAGHGVLAMAADTIWGMYLGLGLIAVGSGGIKPCVSANVGDQFTKENGHLVPRVFLYFYFAINFGSFGATLLIPGLRERYGYEVAFGVPGILMGIATFIFWLGRDRYVRVKPAPGGTLGALDAVSAICLFLAVAALVLGGKLDLGWPARIGVAIGFGVVWFLLFSRRQAIQADKGFISVLVYALRNQKHRKSGDGFFDVGRERFGKEAVEGPPAVLRIMVVFSAVSVFWALFEQHSTSWINQATRMHLPTVDLPLLGPRTLTPSQIPALNPLMVMFLIPVVNGVFIPLIKRLGVVVTPLRKMTAGMFLTALSFVAVAMLQARVDAAEGQVNVLWQIVPYLIITAAEVLVSITGLEFAYTQAPRAMKSTIMGFWLLTVTVGNLLVAFLATFESLPLVQFFWIFAALMAVASVLFAVLSYFYKGRTYLQGEAA